jgi:hypothetical protein
LTTEQHKSQRSTTRMLGQSLDATGAVVGVPIEIRIAHPYIHEKRTKSAAGDPMEKPRYDAVILVPKLHHDATQCPNYLTIQAHCMEAATKAWQGFPQGGKWPIQDGDIPFPQKLKPGKTPLTPEQLIARNKWRTGSWIIEVTNYMDPGPKVTVLQNGRAVEIAAKVVAGTQLYKSGDYGYVSLNAYTFHNKTFGVNFGFEGVLFIRPGELIGSSGQRSADQMFAGIPLQAPAGGAPMPPGAPAAPQMPGPAAPAPTYAQPVAAAPQMASPPMAPAAPPAPTATYAAPPMPPAAPGAVAPPPAAPGGVALPPIPR